MPHGINVLVTGAAGFIGYHLAERLLADGTTVVGVDNLNDYYDVELKEARLDRLRARRRFSFVRMDLEDRTAVARLFAEHAFDRVVHLAAQAGVRYSLERAEAYVDSNLVGFCNMLEACRHNDVGHLVFASSSSVYGANRNIPFAETDSVDHPVSLYAATKKANEVMAHSYAHLYGLPVTGLRFFTVYGPWGRPDMAYYLFTRAILEGRPIKVFNRGEMARDFTYVDDIVEGVVRVLGRIPATRGDWSGDQPDPGSSWAPYRVYNIGGGRPVSLLRFIETLERLLGVEAEKEFCPMQPGDVPVTFADVSRLGAEVGSVPSTPLEVGLRRFVAWYRDYYGVKDRLLAPTGSAVSG